MKRFGIITLLLAFTMAVPALLHSQIIKGEVFVGGNISQVDGDECYHYRKFGVHAGAGALIPITNWMDVGLEKGPTRAIPSTSILAFIQAATTCV